MGNNPSCVNLSSSFSFYDTYKTILDVYTQKQKHFSLILFCIISKKGLIQIHYLCFVILIFLKIYNYNFLLKRNVSGKPDQVYSEHLF